MLPHKWRWRLVSLMLSLSFTHNDTITRRNYLRMEIESGIVSGGFRSVSSQFFTPIHHFYFFPFTTSLIWKIHIKLFSLSLIYFPYNMFLFILIEYISFFSFFKSIYLSARIITFHEHPRSLNAITIFFFFKTSVEIWGVSQF